MCIFCEIIQGNIPSSKVLEDDEFMAFNDINPIAPIHVLIIPKKHIENFNNANSDILQKMGDFIKKVAKKLQITDYRLITNNGASAGQEVFHLHIHLLSNPNGKLKWPKVV
jgi:histidine triad (HIT) family protein